GDIEQVHIEVPGELEKIHVKEGQWVGRGTVLAEFRNLDLENQRDDAWTRYDIKRREVESIETQLFAALRSANPKDAEKLKQEKSAAERDKRSAKQMLDMIEEQLRKPFVRGTPDRILV